MELSSVFALDYGCWLLAAIALMAVLYSSVGHGGASGYLAAMALWGLAPHEMRPAALSMNILVTCWLLYRFQPYKLMPHKLFWPLVLASTPGSFCRWALGDRCRQLSPLSGHATRADRGTDVARQQKPGTGSSAGIRGCCLLSGCCWAFQRA